MLHIMLEAQHRLWQISLTAHERVTVSVPQLRLV